MNTPTPQQRRMLDRIVRCSALRPLLLAVVVISAQAVQAQIPLVFGNETTCDYYVRYSYGNSCSSPGPTCPSSSTFMIFLAAGNNWTGSVPVGKVLCRVSVLDDDGPAGTPGTTRNTVECGGYAFAQEGASCSGSTISHEISAGSVKIQD